MNKLFLGLSLCFFVFFSKSLQAQQSTIAPIPSDSLVEGWNTQGGVGLNFSQVSLNNWAGGGQNSISIGSLLNYQAILKKDRSKWDNTLNLAYGLIRQGDKEAEFRKTDDLINLRSKYDYELNKKWSLTALIDFRTQFDKGYEFPEDNDELEEKLLISEFMAPGFLITTLGFSYSPGKYFTATISPLTGKNTFVFNDSLSNAGAFGVEPGDKLRTELGASIQGSFKKDLAENISLVSNIIFFGNYGEFNHIDVNWDANLLMKINKFITTTVSSQLIYDHDVITKVQLRNSITVGLLYNF